MVMGVQQEYSSSCAKGVLRPRGQRELNPREAGKGGENCQGVRERVEDLSKYSLIFARGGGTGAHLPWAPRAENQDDFSGQNFVLKQAHVLPKVTNILRTWVKFATLRAVRLKVASTGKLPVKGEHL